MFEEKVKIDIIGSGQVVREFLKDQAPRVDIRVYTRQDQKLDHGPLAHFTRPLHTFEPSDRILVLCASTNEENVLKTSNSHARTAVAKENLSIANELLQKDIFKNQIVFVLTNPSELVAEFIYRHSKNKRVFALGLHTDQKRYSEILKQPGFLHLNPSVVVSGNHYDFPNPVFNPPLLMSDEDTSVQLLNSALQAKIKSEFKGHRPPVESGVTALKDLVQALITKKNLYLSGYCHEFDCFSGGSMDFNSFTFSSSLGNSISSKEKIRSAAQKHRHTYFAVTSNHSPKDSI